MVQIQMKPLPSTTDSHPQAQSHKSFDSIVSQHQLSNLTGTHLSEINTGIISKSNLSSFITWTSKADKSSVHPQSSVVCYFDKNQFVLNEFLEYKCMHIFKILQKFAI